MKKYLILILLILFPIVVGAQKNKNRYDIVKDATGDYQYKDKDGFKASFSTNIFNDKIYKDDNGNEVSYAKEIWVDVFPRFNGDEKRILAWLVDVFRDNSNIKEKYDRNIHGDVVYENSSTGFNASLSKNIFDEGIYKDSRGNEVKYSKEFWNDIMSDFRYNDVQVFFWLIDYCEKLDNYSEEYKVDIFGNLQYENNKDGKASLSNDIHGNKVYENKSGNKREYTPAVWNRIVDRHKSEKKAFIWLVNRNATREE